jgi:hypothetical protein
MKQQLERLVSVKSSHRIFIWLRAVDSLGLGVRCGFPAATNAAFSPCLAGEAPNRVVKMLAGLQSSAKALAPVNSDLRVINAI